ncbi:hypothetical protein PV11_02801 [Exophiala sideris]|uniref:Uncharacterized protein n=1 Tax=Exophiala sideris TaxID=1016849 RepID=A0A0D1Z0A7_9EURO|nr:hypothetical protein PV11_02801 [Exophiala sideris]
MAPNSPTLPGRVQPSASASFSTYREANSDSASDSTSAFGPSSRQERENNDVEEAIRLSLREQVIERSRRPSQPAPKSPITSEPSLSLCLSLNNEFTTLDDLKGDTAIYIGPPPELAKKDDPESRYINNHFNQVYVVQSADLKLMGENSRFTHDDLLGPKSVRSEKKLRKLGVLEQAEARHGGRFKYHIDLRIPTEDDEAAELVTLLTCTKGVLTWHLMLERHGLSPLSVLGHDDFGILPPPIAPEIAKAEPSNGEGQNSSTRRTSDASPTSNSAEETSTPQSFVQPRTTGPEYSTLRHCSAIERLLNAIVGNDPKLDSAPKVWTYFAVAKHFGCAEHERVSGWITAWIYSHNNINFIQNNPEVAYRIGMGIKSPDLVRDAFSLLVGERALLNASGRSIPGSTQSVHGREFALLDDDELNRISYAALAFVSRFRDEVGARLQDMSWLCKSSEYEFLSHIVFEDSDENEVVSSAISLVIDYVRYRICHVLCCGLLTFEELERYPSCNPTFRLGPGEDYATVYQGLNPSTRLFTKQFWHALGQSKLEVSPKNVGYGDEDETVLPGGSRFNEALSALGVEKLSDERVSINRIVLNNKIATVNMLFSNKKGEIDPKGKGRADRDVSSAHTQMDDLDSSLPLKALTIESPKHGSRDIEASGQDDLPAKRRKTSEPEQNVGATPTFIAPGDLLFKREDDHDQPWLNKEWRRPPGGDDIVGPQKAPALALRPKKEPGGIVHQVKERVQAAFSRLGSDTAANESPEERERLVDSGDSPVVESWARTSDVFDVREEPVASSDASVGEPSSSNSVFNPWTGKLEDWPMPNTHVAQIPLHVPEYVSYTEPVQEVPPPTPAAASWDYNKYALYPVDPQKMLLEISHQVTNMCADFLYPSHLFHDTVLLPTGLFDNLMCITANEIRFLPLWCNGNDDGSGGVFAEAPIDTNEAERVVFGPGKPRAPGFESDEAFEDIASQAVSTVGKASKLATDGTQTVKSLSSVSVGESAATETVRLDDSRSLASGAFSDDDMCDDNDDPNLEFSDFDDGAEDSDADTVIDEAGGVRLSGPTPWLDEIHGHNQDVSSSSHATASGSGTNTSIGTSSEEVAQEDPTDMDGDSSSDSDNDDGFEWV